METSDLLPSSQLPFENAEAIRTPELDSSTCLAWEAYDVEHGGRHLFIKQLRPELYADGRMRDSFIKEYSIGSSLNSEYFPRYLSLSNDEQRLSITMAYLDGDTLDHRLDSMPNYFRSMVNLRRFIYQMLEALNDLHSVGIVHLDLKPQNIIITRRTDNVRIIDLGYSCTDDWFSTIGGTMSYAAPELNSKGADSVCAASDIYSFGIILQHIVARSGVRLPKALRRIIIKCTHESLADRYSCAQEVIEDVDAYFNRKKSSVWKIIAASVAATLILVISCVGLYRFWYAEEFTVDGFSYKVYDYHGYGGVMITDADDEVVTDSTLKTSDHVTFHGRTYDVIAVSEKAFLGKKNIRNIEFNFEMREINNYAFYGCPSLKSVFLSKNIRSVNNGAFADCQTLDTFVVAKNNPWLYVKDGVLFSHEGKILRQCPATRKGEYTVPNGIMRIFNCAFQDCRLLTRITIPGSVVHLDSDVFKGCTSLKSITIPSTTPELPNSAFHCCI